MPLIVAVEVFVFQFRDRDGRPARSLVLTHGALVAVPLVLFLLLLAAWPARFLGGYALRPFSLVERLLTQGRVLLDYVVQIFWVDVHRLGVYHDDFTISTGLFSPPGTAFALLFWLGAGIAVVACAVKRRFRLAAFGVAFFMVGHAMESTVIPLEIYFEHRNYLPAFGLLFALIAFANQLQARWEPARGWVTALALLFIGRNLLLLGSQAVIWSDTHLLHMEAANYHPRSERALLALAQVYAGEGNLDVALELAERADLVDGREAAPAQVLRAVFHCMAAKPIPPDLLSASTLTDEDIADPHFGDHVYYMTRLAISGR